MKKTYQYVLFDLDGTLTDSAAGITNSVQHALKAYGINSSPEELKSFIGPPLHLSFINKYGFSEEKSFQAVEYYRDYYRDKGIYENKLYPAVPAMLEAIAGNNAKLGVATSKPTVFAEKILSHFNLSKYFSIIAGSNLDGTRVEKSEVIAYALSEIGNPDKSETVMVGDRKHDIRGARSHGLASVAVTYGYGSLDELTAAGPTCMVHSVEELKDLLA